MSLLTRAGEQARAGRVRLKSDHLLYNSFYLALTTATMGVLGFLFWLLNARLFSASEIGKATLLISATSLISYLSLLGFNNTFIRFLPTAEDPAGHINTGLRPLLRDGDRPRFGLRPRPSALRPRAHGSSGTRRGTPLVSSSSPPARP